MDIRHFLHHYHIDIHFLNPVRRSKRLFMWFGIHHPATPGLNPNFAGDELVKKRQEAC